MNATQSRTTPKTIDALLAEGRAILAAQDADERRVEERLDADMKANWRALREQAIKDMGELARLHITAEVPDTFGPERREWTFAITPFGGSSLTVRYAKTCSESDWQMEGECSHGYRHNPICVQTEFALRWEGDEDTPPAWHVVPSLWHETDNLAEAVALCHRVSTTTYYESVQESQRRKPPAWVLKANEEKPLILSAAEKTLLLSLRGWAADELERAGE